MATAWIISSVFLYIYFLASGSLRKLGFFQFCPAFQQVSLLIRIHRNNCAGEEKSFLSILVFLGSFLHICWERSEWKREQCRLGAPPTASKHHPNIASLRKGTPDSK